MNGGQCEGEGWVYGRDGVSYTAPSCSFLAGSCTHTHMPHMSCGIKVMSHTWFGG